MPGMESQQETGLMAVYYFFFIMIDILEALLLSLKRR